MKETLRRVGVLEMYMLFFYLAKLQVGSECMLNLPGKYRRSRGFPEGSKWMYHIQNRLYCRDVDGCSSRITSI